MNWIKKALLAVGLLFCAGASANATTYTVKAAGGGNYTTISQCAAVANAGDTCVVYVGTYNETITPHTSGSSGSPITFSVNPGDCVTINGGFSINTNGSYIVIGNPPGSNCSTTTPTGIHSHPGFYFTGAAGVTFGTANHITFEGNYVYSAGGADCVQGPGSMSQGTITYLYILNNTLDTCGGVGNVGNAGGISMEGSYILIDGNTIEHVADGMYAYGSFIVVRNNHLGPITGAEEGSNHADGLESTCGTGQDYPLLHLLYEGNVTQNWGSADQSEGSANAHGMLIADWNNPPSGAKCGSAQEVIRYSQFMQLGSDMWTEGGSPTESGVPMLAFYNNTSLYTDLSNKEASSLDFTDDNAGMGTVINFIQINDWQNSPPYCIYVNVTAFLNPPWAENNNLCYTTAMSSGSWLTGVNTYNTTTGLADIFNKDPKLVNETSGGPNNLALQSSSPAIGAGGRLTTTTNTGNNTGTTLATALNLTNASLFQDGYGLTGVQPDWIRLGASTTVQIAPGGIQWSSSRTVPATVVILASPVTWTSGEAVYLFKKSDGVQVLSATSGVMPDIGALPYSVVTSSYTISVTVSNLTGTGLVLQDNNGDNLNISSGNGTYTFMTAIASGANYAVTVYTSPSSPTQSCIVGGGGNGNGSGIVGSANVSGITVNCGTAYTITGNVMGLSGSGLVLQDNGGDNLPINMGSGTYTFATAIVTGNPYAVTVFTQPTVPNQTCTVTGGDNGNGSGTVAGAPVTSIVITCVTAYTISVNVTPLLGTNLVLYDNGGDALTINATGTYTFPTAIINGGPYNVTVHTPPSSPTQTCTITSGMGSVISANVTIGVACATNSYTIGGTVVGLTGSGLSLYDNGGDNLSISGNGMFTFMTSVASGVTYTVTIHTQPTSTPLQTCVVNPYTGVVGGAPVTTVVVTCTNNSSQVNTVSTFAPWSNGTNGASATNAVLNAGTFGAGAGGWSGGGVPFTICSAADFPTVIATQVIGGSLYPAGTGTQGLCFGLATGGNMNESVSGNIVTLYLVVNLGNIANVYSNPVIIQAPFGSSFEDVGFTIGASGNGSLLEMECDMDSPEDYPISGNHAAQANTDYGIWLQFNKTSGHKIAIYSTPLTNPTLLGTSTCPAKGVAASSLGLGEYHGGATGTATTREFGPMLWDTSGNVNAITVIPSGAGATYTIGGTVTGLVGSGLFLQDNMMDNLAITANGSFTFATALAAGASYSTMVLTEPSTPTQTCTITSGSGTVPSAPVTNIMVSCTTNSYTISGTVLNLSGTGLVLQDNGGDNLTINANGGFTFGTSVASGAMYNVTVLTNPTSPTQNCLVTLGTGSVVSSKVTTVVVNCAAYTIGVTVTGLTGTGLVLQDNSGSNLTINANGNYTFATPVANGAMYGVTVLTPPSSPTQSCTITSGTGTVNSANVTGIGVACAANSYTIGGTITSLSGSGLVLQDNSGNNKMISGTGTVNFTFSTALASGSMYDVTVFSQPSTPTQICTPTMNTGTVGGANVTTVAVACVTQSYTIGGMVSGLSGTGLKLYDNGGNSKTITTNGAFTFSTSVASGAMYNVTIQTNPTGPTQICTPTMNTGTVGGAPVTTVVVNCVTQSYTIGGNVTGLTGTDLVLQDNSADNLTINVNGMFTFMTAISSGSTYAVTILTQPSSPNQTCFITANGSGMVTTAAISNVTVFCDATAISTTSLPNGVQSVVYSTTLAATGGLAPYTWSITSGSLPMGLTLNASTGVISGTPTGSTGTSSFTIQVEDAHSITNTAMLSIKVVAAPAAGLSIFINGF